MKLFDSFTGSRLADLETPEGGTRSSSHGDDLIADACAHRTTELRLVWLNTNAREGNHMSTLVRFTPKSVTTDQYDKVMRQLHESDDWLPDGLEYHVAFGSRGDVRVSEIWDSKEQFEEFGKRLMPLLQEAGIELMGPPELIEIYKIEKR
jgi:hypothetical protein